MYPVFGVINWGYSSHSSVSLAMYDATLCKFLGVTFSSNYCTCLYPRFIQALISMPLSSDLPTLFQYGQLQSSCITGTEFWLNSNSIYTLDYRHFTTLCILWNYLLHASVLCSQQCVLVLMCWVWPLALAFRFQKYFSQLLAFYGLQSFLEKYWPQNLYKLVSDRLPVVKKYIVCCNHLNHWMDVTGIIFTFSFWKQYLFHHAWHGYRHHHLVRRQCAVFLM